MPAEWHGSLQDTGGMGADGRWRRYDLGAYDAELHAVFLGFVMLIR